MKLKFQISFDRPQGHEIAVAPSTPAHQIFADAGKDQQAHPFLVGYVNLMQSAAHQEIKPGKPIYVCSGWVGHCTQRF